jgi:S-adenosylmethionine synthetase
MVHLFSSESVTSGHPDKLCDYISDSILDECLKIDPFARVAIEVFVKGLDGMNGNEPRCFIIIGGEITINSDIDVDYEEIARKCAIEIGYSDMEIGMDASDTKSCEVIILISRQSEEISQGVYLEKNDRLDIGAGDQGIIFGYATNESENYELTKGCFMPLPIILAHKLTREITKNRLNGDLPWSRPDGKSQVTVAYDKKGNPSYIDAIVIAVQHDDMIGKLFKNEVLEHQYITKQITDKIIKKVIPKELLDDNIKIIVNGTGRFCKGGPHADAGLTGRKIIVDTYGGSGRHGGGAFSGKDPTKVDRSAAYYARWVAKHIVASRLADKCEIQLAYSIGLAEPVSMSITTEKNGTRIESNEKIISLIRKNFDFRPANIIKHLELRNPIYAVTSSGGHFGRVSKNGTFSWEKIDKNIVEKLRSETNEKNN